MRSPTTWETVPGQNRGLALPEPFSSFDQSSILVLILLVFLSQIPCGTCHASAFTLSKFYSNLIVCLINIQGKSSPVGSGFTSNTGDKDHPLIVSKKHDSANDHPYWKRTCHGIYPRQVLHSQIYQSPEAPHKHHKKKYREEHRKELDQYQETLSFFREHSDGKVPSI